MLYIVETVHAGAGDLEIEINGGSVPCTIQPRGNRRFRASFTPRMAIPHDVEVRFNGQEIAGMFFVSDLSLVLYSLRTICRLS